MKKYDIAGYDMPCVDLLVNVDVFPKPNGGTGVNALSWQGGGKVASGLAAAARLGARCAILGAVGSDDYGRFVEKDFQRHGVDTAGLYPREGETTSLSIVISDRETQGRSIVYRHGSAAPLDPHELNQAVLADCQWFFISHVTETAMAGVRQAKAAGAKVMVDADSYSSELMEQIGQINVFIGSEFFYDVLFHDKNYQANCKEICAKGPEVAVFTLGPKGSVGYSQEAGFFQVPAYQVPVMDTTGAGDVFHGAYLAAAVRGLAPVECARVATAAACIKCTRMGGRAGVPDWDTAQKLLQTGEIDYTEIDRRAAFYAAGLQL
ncbi:carbohydrate kinase family protein [Acutalibacter intestini]|uniref:carbohydrate kinase family protein n=1 Tax=Acutalibacter intestini TaxID=3093659 RepID=UPI002AC96062|nr:carbohydrate kinase family protein [Acutalibacter sp. M00204]